MKTNKTSNVSARNTTRRAATKMALAAVSTPPFNFPGFLGIAAIGFSIFRAAPRAFTTEDLRIRIIAFGFAIIGCLVGAILIKLSYRGYEASQVQLLAKSLEAYRQGGFREAIECCDTIIRTNPANKRAWNNKGAALYKLDELQEAMECFDKALPLRQAQFNKAAILHEMAL